ncbi:MAG: FAD-binding protein [Firmicutes bacterium]|nr:FAD-binding protein [Bacillota bacterium]
MYDVAIVGAGPAGSTLARLIGSQLKVLLIDKRIPSKSNKVEYRTSKCCGGLLAPDAQKMMALLGLGLPKDLVVGPQLFAVRTIDMQNVIERYYQRFYINIDRRKFDSWLVSLIPGTVELRLGCTFKSFSKENGHFQIKFMQSNSEYIERTRFLVGADGAFSMVRRAAFPDYPLPAKYTAVQEWLHSEEKQPYFTTIFDSEISDFYAWTIPKEDMMLFGAAIPQRYNVNSKFNLLKNKLGSYGFKLGPAKKREGTFILRPVNINQICTGANGIALIGEAAGWISPTSAEGLSYAFRSALACAKSIGQDTRDFTDTYRKNTSGMFLNVRLKNLKSPFMYHPLLRKGIMSSGIMSMDVNSGIL